MFQLLVQGKIKIDFDTSPKNIYESYFKYLDCEIKQLFNSININFISLFEDLAYQIFNEGVESFSLDLIEEVLTKKLSNLKREECISIINWLTDVQKFLVPTSLSDISFFHQSITEFLAAHSLANQFIHNEDILNNKLFYVRWNYVLLFAVGFLDDEKADGTVKNFAQN